MTYLYEIDKIYLVDEENVKVGYVDYRIDNGILILNKVYVLPNYQGKGYARLIMDEAVVFAQKEKYLVRPICSYAIGYFEKNPLLKDLLESK